MRRAHALALAAVALALIAGAACGEGRQDEEAEEGQLGRDRVDAEGNVVLNEREREALGLETAPVEQGSVTATATRYGRVIGRPDEDVLVTAPVMGRLVAPLVTLGAHVEAGDALAEIEPLVDSASRAALEARRRELTGQIEGAHARVTAEQSNRARVAALAAAGLATEAELAGADAEMTALSTRAESLQRARAELGRMTGGHMTLRAPVAGIVALVDSDTGSLIEQGSTVVRIVREGPRWIDLAAAPDDSVGDGYLAIGLTGAVRVSFVMRGAVVDPDGTRRDRLEAPPEAAASLPPGATVPVEVEHRASGLVVPGDAVVRGASEAAVFVAREEGHYAPRRVEVVARDDQDRVVVTGALEAGDLVVTRGAIELLGEVIAAGRWTEAQAAP